ncbi:hypothetical protein HX056_04830 [Myroides odoratimimus]|uniref:hypothetical protein n=1 Tax=Myroides odoratimimus TaxID=76832 RepID=UPI0009201695|nr:hypothetical protein [Myroides odoratimimus]MDM1442659.1 hypothetical protein [Myroides odoratimimus]SHL89511.1 hypothetical protein SAMN05444275_107130 [Myroides odoratimimus subsp. xuanwuensis]
MKKKLVITLSLLANIGLYAQTGIGTTLPNSTSVLDVESSDKGVLIPRVNLLNDTDKTTIKGGDYPESLIVYHNGTKDLIAGFYYWEKKKWNVLISNTNLYEYIKKEAKQDTVMITQDNGDYIFTWKDDKGVEQTMKISDVIKKFETLTEFKGAIEGSEAVLTYKPERGVETKVLLTDLLKKSTDFETYIKSLITTNVVVPTTVVANGNGTEVAKTIDTNSNTTTYKVSVVPTEIDLTGDVGGKAGDNTINKIKKVTVSPTPPTTTGQALVYNDATKVWEPGKPAVNTGDITGKANLTTDGVIVVGDATTGTNSSANAVLAATTLSIKKESITSSLIKDGTIELTDMKKGDANAVLTTNTTGELKWEPRADLGNIITANNGITKTVNNIELGGALTKPTTITTTATNELIITGLPMAKVGIDNIVMRDAVTGALRQSKGTMPSFFHMPSVMLPTAEGQTTQAGITFNNATRTGIVDLYLIYKNQFTTPVRSSVAGAKLPVLNATDMVYHITYIDTTVFTITGLTTDGKLTYTVSATAKPSLASFANVIFAVNN